MRGGLNYCNVTGGFGSGTLRSGQYSQTKGEEAGLSDSGFRLLKLIWRLQIGHLGQGLYMPHPIRPALQRTGISNEALLVPQRTYTPLGAELNPWSGPSPSLLGSLDSFAALGA